MRTNRNQPPNIKEDTLREIKRLLTGDRESFKPASFKESLKYNFLGITPEREETSGGFGRALIDETKSQFKQLFGIKTSKKEREQEIEAEAEKIRQQQEEESRKKQLEENNAKAITDAATSLKELQETTKAMLGEVTTLRKVTEGSVKREKKGRYRDVDTGRYVSSEKVRETARMGGTDVPTAEEGNAAVISQLEKLNAAMEELDIGDSKTNVNIGNRGILDRLFTRKTTGEVAKKTGTRAATKTASTKAGQKAATSVLGRIGMKGGAGAIAKKIPLLGAAVGLGFGVKRLLEGDAAGAGLEVASGVASTFPGLGTGASVAIDAGLIARDLNKAAALENSAQAATPAPVVVNNVDASSNPVVAPSAPAASQNVTVTLRDSHGSHLRFQENRLTRPM